MPSRLAHVFAPALLILTGLLCWPGPPALAQPDGSPSEPAWQIEDPVAFGFEPAALDSVFRRAADMAPLNSLLIARGDTLVAARYFRGMTPTTPANVKSASKSLLSALVGLALEDGHLDSLTQPIGPFFPDVLRGDSVKQSITLKDLLTMRAGLESTSFGNYGAWVSTDDWARDALERPLVRPPGTRMIYSTGTSHLVAVLLQKAVGMDLNTYAQRRLFDPLGVRIRSWQTSPQGYRFGGNNLALTPIGLLRVGQLYLNGGRWQGRQVLPVGWVATSWRPYVTRSFRGFDYGLFWWHERFGGRRTYFAWGYGGQFVFIVPTLDLVVVVTSSLTDRPPGTRDHSGRVFRFINRTVVPLLTTPDADLRF